MTFPSDRVAFAGVSVLVNHSRGETPAEARRKVQQACEWIAASGTKLYYKKIDSTLKGNVGAELEAIRERFPDRLILVSPPFPKMGRTLVDGWLKVESGEAVDPVHMPSLLTGQGARSLTHIPQPAGPDAGVTLLASIQKAQAAGARIIIIDAVSENHLRAHCRGLQFRLPRSLCWWVQRDWRRHGASCY